MRRFPRLGWLGGGVLLLGLVLDAVVHLSTREGAPAGGFSLPQHSAHLVVLIGMVVLLAGVVIDGVRISRDRALRSEGDSRALR